MGFKYTNIKWKSARLQNFIYVVLSYFFHIFFSVLVKTIFDEIYGYSLADYLRNITFDITSVGKVARASPGAPALASPLPFRVSATLATSQAASCGPELPADPVRFPDRRCSLCWGWTDAGQPSSCLTRHRLSAVALSLFATTAPMSL